MPFFRRLRQRLMRPELPPHCPACDSRLPLELVGRDRFFCAGCGKDFGAVKLGDGWKFDVTPLRFRTGNGRFSP
jgi:hypothetical protein